MVTTHSPQLNEPLSAKKSGRFRSRVSTKRKRNAYFTLNQRGIIWLCGKCNKCYEVIVMAINYANLAALSERLIRKWPDALLITETNTGTDYQPTISQSSATIKLVQTQFNAQDNNDFVLQAHDVKFWYQSAFTVSAKQRIETNGLQYSIVAVKEIKPSDTSILYIVQGVYNVV